MKSLAITLIIITTGLLAFSQDNQNHSKSVVENIKHYYEQATVYDNQNDFASANKNYNLVLELFRSHPEPKSTKIYAAACYRLADDYFFRKSDDSKAMNYVTEGLNVQPDYKDLEILEAVILGSENDNRQKAIDKFDYLAAKYPDDEGLSLHYAQFLEHFNPMGAAVQYEKVLEKQPFNTEVLLMLGTIYNNEASRIAPTSTHPEDVFALSEKAMSYFDRAYKLHPDDEEIANILEIIHNELNLPEKSPNKNVPF